MEQAVNFRASINKLNHAEFDLFWSKLYSKKNLIIQSLFHLFVHDSKRNKYNNVTEINSIIKDILDLRPKTSGVNNETANEVISFKQLSSHNIGYIASYLTLSEQTLFMRCNRDIFSSTMSHPSRIHTITSKNTWLWHYFRKHGPQYTEFQVEKLGHFRFIKKVRCKYNMLNSKYACLFRLCKWESLHFLQLHNFFSNTSFHLDGINILKKIQLKHLSLSQQFAHRVSVSELSEVIHANCNIECISLINLNLERNLVSNTIETTGKGLNLKGLMLKENTKWDSVRIALPKFGNNLQSLHIDNLCGNILNHMNIGSDLQEICMTNLQNSEAIVYISNKCSKLRRFQWKLSQPESLKNTKTILKNILMNNCNLEYLCVDSQLNANMNIENAIMNKFKELFKLEKWKRNNFKLRMCFRNGFDFGNGLTDLVNALNSFVLNDFMFIFTIQLKNKNDVNITLQNEINLIRKKYLVNIWDYNGEKNQIERQICICNNKNKMCGFHETWMYTCKDCNH